MEKIRPKKEKSKLYTTFRFVLSSHFHFSNRDETYFMYLCFQVLVSGDESGLINIWTLKDKGLKLLRSIDPFGEFPVTCLSLWNKIWHGKYKGKWDGVQSPKQVMTKI